MQENTHPDIKCHHVPMTLFLGRNNLEAHALLFVIAISRYRRIFLSGTKAVSQKQKHTVHVCNSYVWKWKRSAVTLFEKTNRFPLKDTAARNAGNLSRFAPTAKAAGCVLRTCKCSRKSFKSSTMWHPGQVCIWPSPDQVTVSWLIWFRFSCWIL